MKRYKLQIIDKRTLEVVESQELNSISSVILKPRYMLYTVLGLIVALVLTIAISVNSSKHQQEQMVQLQSQFNIESSNYEHCLMHAQLNNMIGEAMKASNVTYDSIDEVYEYIKRSGVWYPDIVMAQFILESGSGTSNVSKEANNYFGMKPARTRDRVNLEGNNYNGYASYKNWKLSVLDRRLWELMWFDEEKPTLQQYKKSLTKYAEDPQYINKLEKIIKEHKVFTK